GLLQVLGPDWQTFSLYVFAFIPARLTHAAYAAPTGAAYWTFLSHAFLHGSWLHLAMNSLWLLVFGTVVARSLGAARFLLLSAISAIAGAAAMLVNHWGEALIMVGASGAISGMLGATMPVMYGRRLSPGPMGSAGTTRALRPGEFLRDRNAVMFTLIWLTVTLVTGGVGVSDNSFGGEAAIAWEAHIGGFIAGIVAFYGLQSEGAVRR
ncbi:MAG: rhomboid family intramembrane serine protease, partial [Alphaproteobacteria bacterium]|nr:rhomboid family intramembrane serine protease [Alphaproteobacteria bacterium]